LFPEKGVHIELVSRISGQSNFVGPKEFEDILNQMQVLILDERSEFKLNLQSGFSKK